MRAEDYNEDEEDEDEEDDEEDEELGHISAEDLRALAAYGRKHGLPDADDDEDEVISRAFGYPTYRCKHGVVLPVD